MPLKREHLLLVRREIGEDEGEGFSTEICLQICRHLDSEPSNRTHACRRIANELERLKLGYFGDVSDAGSLLMSCKFNNVTVGAFSDCVHSLAIARLDIAREVYLPSTQYSASVKIAVLIGQQHYGHRLTSLLTVANDLDDLAEVLRGAGFSVFSLIDTSLRLVWSLLVRISIICRLTPGSYVIFYIGGHGFTTQKGQYIMPSKVDSDTPAGLISYEQCFSVAKAQRLIASSNPAILLTLVDACRTKYDEIIGEEPNFSTDSLSNIFTIFSTSRGHSSFEPCEGRNSVFTSALLQALKEKVTVHELYRRLKIDLKNLENEIAVFQCPEIIGNYEPDRCLYDDISVVDSNTAEEASRKINDIIRVMHAIPKTIKNLLRGNGFSLSYSLVFRELFTNRMSMRFQNQHRMTLTSLSIDILSEAIPYKNIDNIIYFELDTLMDELVISVRIELRTFLGREHTISLSRIMIGRPLISVINNCRKVNKIK